MVERMQVALIVWDTQFRAQFWNPAAENMFGFTRHEALGKHAFDLIVLPELQSYAQVMWDRLLNGDAAASRSINENITKNGIRIICHWSNTLLKDPDGTPIGVISMAQDITQTQQGQKALQESENKYRSLVNNVKLGIFRSTSKGGYLEVNKAMETITGYGREELLSMNIIDLYLYPEERQEILEQMVAHPEKTYQEISYKKKNGARIVVSINITPVAGPDGQVLYFDGILEDITERKRLEDQLKDLYAKEKAQRQELEEEARARGMFIDVLGHDLRTPLTPILVSIGLLKESLKDNSDGLQNRMVSNISQGAEVMVQRLDELLDLGQFSRGEVSLEFEPIDLARFVVDIGVRFDEEARKKGQTLTLAVADDLPRIKVDTLRLSQVLSHLLSNASKLSPEGRKITFRVEKDGEGVLIEVHDEGKAIPPEKQKRLFQPYHRVEQDRNEFTGMGLRLALSRQIIEMHGGRIWITSQEDRGNTFSIFLPTDPEKRFYAKLERDINIHRV